MRYPLLDLLKVPIDRVEAHLHRLQRLLQILLGDRAWMDVLNVPGMIRLDRFIDLRRNRIQNHRHYDHSMQASD